VGQSVLWAGACFGPERALVRSSVNTKVDAI
jgi:hypothetical protein